MRITSNMFPTNLKLESNNLMQQEYNVQNQIATGENFINPSDDPAAFSQVSALRGENAQANAYLNVTNSVNLQAQSTYQGMSSLQTVLTSIGELMTEANNSSSQTQLQIYGNQMQGYAQSILQIVNQQSNGVYTYGSTTNQPPLLAQTPASANTFSTAVAGIAGTDTISVNGFSIALTSSDTLTTLQNQLNQKGTGVTASLDPTGHLLLTSTTANVSVTGATGAGSFLGGLGFTSSPINASIQLNNTTQSGYSSAVPTSTINTNLSVSLGLTAGSNTDPTSSNNFAGFLTDGTAGTPDLYNLVVNAANDMLNATGTGADAFAGDTTLGSSYQAAVKTINGEIDNTSKYVGRASAQLALIEGNQTDLNNTILNQKQGLSNLTSLDTASAATDLTEIQTAYQAALQSGAKILNLSLMNYLQ